MPLLKHAKKKLKQDKVRTIRNKKVKNAFKLTVKKAREGASEKTVSAAFKAMDKAVKKNIIHKNKAARMKSALSKLVGGKRKTSTASTTTKKTDAKTTKSKAATKSKTQAKDKKSNDQENSL